MINKFKKILRKKMKEKKPKHIEHFGLLCILTYKEVSSNLEGYSIDNATIALDKLSAFSTRLIHMSKKYLKPMKKVDRKKSFKNTIKNMFGRKVKKS